jgi:phosphoribosylanthranilate isomerase
VKATNHCILIDDSGGRGISPSIWSAPHTSKQIGFAGGLGLDNLAGELEKIHAVAGTGSWVDMEGKLRTHDLFDLDKAEACINILRDCW